MDTRSIYEPLDPSRNEIRLLHILPETFFPDRPDDIFCTIKRISLQDAKDTYKALSYSWGTKIAVKQIHVCVNGSEIPVTLQENLYQALFHLRDIHEDISGPFIVWADALCINQSDDIEK
ncbi:hypothetical protein BKA65DRAFT_377244, partial [Rhexocercosporidium sp. MPI-PUGE-AT-0058]